MTYTLETPPELHIIKGAKSVISAADGYIILDYDGAMMMLPSTKTEDEIIQDIVEKTDLWAFCAELPEVQTLQSHEGVIQYLYVKGVLDKFHNE